MARWQPLWQIQLSHPTPTSSKPSDQPAHLQQSKLQRQIQAWLDFSQIAINDSDSFSPLQPDDKIPAAAGQQPSVDRPCIFHIGSTVAHHYDRASVSTRLALVDPAATRWDLDPTCEPISMGSGRTTICSTEPIIVRSFLPQICFLSVNIATVNRLWNPF
ncbi:hypothetical protein ACLOJK_015168 [Asimina triloba]